MNARVTEAITPERYEASYNGYPIVNDDPSLLKKLYNTKKLKQFSFIILTYSPLSNLWTISFQVATDMHIVLRTYPL